MNKLIVLLSVILLASCGQDTKKSSTDSVKSDTITKDTIGPAVTFYKVRSKAILIGDNIKLLDENFREIRDITYLHEQFVEVTEVSDNYCKAKPTDGYCDEFKYVKIKYKDLEGYVDGRKLYEPIDNTQNKILKINSKEVAFVVTSNFGIGPVHDDGLTNCTGHTPVVFSDEGEQYEGLVKMIKNKNYMSDYPYWELKDDAGAVDEIESVTKKDGKYLLRIKRRYQEGGAKLLVTIGKDTNGVFVAEVLEDVRVGE